MRILILISGKSTFRKTSIEPDIENRVQEQRVEQSYIAYLRHKEEIEQEHI